MRSVVVLAVVGVLWAGAAISEEPAMTAGELAQLCQGVDTTSRNVCRIYILGVTQGMSIGISIADGKTPVGRPCIPENLSSNSLGALVKGKLVQDLNAHPADRDREASGFIASVITSKFSCSKERPG